MTYTMSNSLKEEIVNYAKDKGLTLSNGYYYDFRDNIFGGKMNREIEESFLEGDGNELVSKACAPHSSSMLGYNFFHWIKEDNPLTINFKDGINTYNKVFFEVKIPVISRGYANMDVVLRNEKGDWLFIESKFLEYLNTGSFDLSESYKKKKDKDPYYYNGNKWRRFINNYSFNAKGQYWGGIKQELCHLIGLTNWMQYKEAKPIQIKKNNYKYDGSEIRFINLVFEPNSKDFKKEHNSFSNYQTLYEEFSDNLNSTNLNKNLVGKLKMEFMTYSELWENIKNNTVLVQNGLIDYLKNRYMAFAEIK